MACLICISVRINNLNMSNLDISIIRKVGFIVPTTRIGTLFSSDLLQQNNKHILTLLIKPFQFQRTPVFQSNESTTDAEKSEFPAKSNFLIYLKTLSEILLTLFASLSAESLFRNTLLCCCLETSGEKRSYIINLIKHYCKPLCDVNKTRESA